MQIIHSDIVRLQHGSQAIAELGKGSAIYVVHVHSS